MLPFRQFLRCSLFFQCDYSFLWHGFIPLSLCRKLRRWSVWEGNRANFFDEDIGQRWLGQLETADDSAVVQRGFHDHIGVEVGLNVHLDVVLPAPGDLYTF